MKPIRIAGLFSLLVVLDPLYAQTSMISKEQLHEMFSSIEEKTDWNISGDMTWGYFFTDSDKSDLERVAPILSEMGYSVKAIFLSDKESKDESDLWWLHVEKIETHSVDSLDATNLSFYAFAEEHHLDSYDGMDVGPIEIPD